LCPQPEEILQTDFFSPDELPEDFLYGHRQRIMDALNGVGGGVVWTQAVPWPFDPSFTRADIYALRDRSGLSRLEYYQSFFSPPKPGDVIYELSAKPHPAYSALENLHAANPKNRIP
jgi:hypothetical protein